jgi:Tfp pilus assembly protein PilN
MINLLPPTLKEQIRFAKYNRLILRYLRVTIVVVAILGGIFVWAFRDLSQRTQLVATDVEAKQKTIAGLSKTFLPKAKDASERLNAIKFAQTTQTKFSALIADVTSVIPAGVSIDTMTLNGDEKKSVRMVVSTVTYDQVLALRNALVTSPRISGADIETITLTETSPKYHYKASLVLGFNPGKAK